MSDLDQPTRQALCQLLHEVAGALFLVVEEGDPKVFSRGHYENAFIRVEDMRAKIECPKT